MKNKFLLILFVLSIHFSVAQTWKQWRNGVASTVHPTFIDTSSNTLYAGGYFISSTGDSILGIAKLDGSNWDSLGYLYRYNIYSILKYRDTIYAAGLFTTAQGATANCIAKFNGSTWDSLYASPSSGILDMIVFNDRLWVTGWLYQIGNLYPKYVAYYDGLWHTVPELPWALAVGLKFQIYNGDLYFGGDWRDIQPYDGVVKWNGTGWDSLGNGFFPVQSDMYRLVTDMVVYNGELYVSGDFALTHNAPGTYIARWDGNQWHTVGSVSPDYYIYDMQVYHNELYVTGPFSEIGGIPCNGVAKWDGSKWCCVDNSAGGYIFVYNDSLIVSGGFHFVSNGDSVNYAAVWIGGNHVDTCSSPIGISEYELMLSEFYFYPNPSTSIITINYPLKSHPYSLSIKDAIGREIKEEKLPANAMKKEIDVSELARGVYFVTLEGEKGRVTKRLIKE